MDDEYENTNENDENIPSGDSNCPRCGLRTYAEICPGCGMPLSIDKNEDDEEDEYYERRRERR